MTIDIPNVGKYDIKHIVFDYNGTIASSGKLFNIIPKIKQLTKTFHVHVFTGNTFDSINTEIEIEGITVTITNTASDKLHALEKLNPLCCIAVGNGSIDYQMLKAAAIGIAVIDDEGCSTKAILNADLIINDIFDVFELINQPKKIIASLKE